MVGETEITVLPMAEGDLDALAALEKRCFSRPWSRALLAAALGDPQACFYTAHIGGAAVGYAGMHRVLDEGYLDNVAVHPDFRRRGVATALLGALDGSARRYGLKLLTLEARVSNVPAVTAYHRAGYGDVGVRPGFYEDPREDALIMTKYF